MNRMMEQLESERDRVEEVFCLVDNIRHGRACGVSVIVWKTTNLSSGCRYSTCKDYIKGASRVSSKDNSGIHTRIHRSPIFQNS